MGALKLILGGLAGGLVGAGIWAGIAYMTDYEIGWIAWGVGALVGFGVRALGSSEMATFDRATRQRVVRRVPAMAPALAGLVAAIIAMGAVMAGKYATIHLVLSDMLAAPEAADTEMILSGVADEIVMEREEAGRHVQFPPGMDYESASKQADYPPDIWKEAQVRWASLSPDQQAAWLQERGERVRAVMGAMGGAGGIALLMSSLGVFDILWFGLAGWTAFKLGMSIEE